MPSLTATLAAMQQSYEDATPFMASLLERVASINASVLVLPADMQSSVEKLVDAKVCCRRG